MEHCLLLHAHCPLSCGICEGKWNIIVYNEIMKRVRLILLLCIVGCQDMVTWCEEAMRTNYRYCYSQPLFALNMCRRTCRMCRGDCYDHHVQCKQWSHKGACEKNPHYMQRYCMKSCGSCN